MPIELELFLRLLLSGILGGLIGFQRQKAEKPAGVRDLALISLGAALFTVISGFGFNDADPSRIAAGIVTGVGFLGAGVIIRREEGVVRGLTTAATVWVAAGIGMAAGAGLYIVAVLATLVSLGILFIPKKL